MTNNILLMVICHGIIWSTRPNSPRDGENKWGYELGLFYRSTRDLLWLGEDDLYGTARYENIDTLHSAGGGPVP